MSSKWKLLKTLKERKEMNNQMKIKEEEEKPVSRGVEYLLVMYEWAGLVI
jgi:hypothetical protein